MGGGERGETKEVANQLLLMLHTQRGDPYLSEQRGDMGVGGQIKSLPNGFSQGRVHLSTHGGTRGVEGQSIGRNSSHTGLGESDGGVDVGLGGEEAGGEVGRLSGLGHHLTSMNVKGTIGTKNHTHVLVLRGEEEGSTREKKWSRWMSGAEPGVGLRGYIETKHHQVGFAMGELELHSPLSGPVGADVESVLKLLAGVESKVKGRGEKRCN
jgi:hypothetical protein